MSTRAFHQVVATTDVHSALDHADGLLTHLHQLRDTSLMTDCGDFFEGTGYYRLGGGHAEREILTTLYDVLAPGNHGWPHYFESGLHEMTVCANTVDARSGTPLFDRLRIVDIQDRRVAITAVMGLQAFNSIPAHQRAGHHVIDPATALRGLMLEHHHHVDSWMVLSHSGFAEDLELALACPFLGVIFAGHCHSDTYGPVPVGDTLVVKGGELGAGYSVAEPSASGWAARTTPFPSTGPLPRPLVGLAGQIAPLSRRLAQSLGTVNGPYRNGELDRNRLLADLATRLHTELGTAVVLNVTALRTTVLGDVLTLADLLAIEPFDNQLVHAFLPAPYGHDPAHLIADLTEQTGPVAFVPEPPTTPLVSVLTTGYLADTYLGGRTRQTGLTLCDSVRRTLTTAQPEREHR
ncbi:bifunctional metallophosphatase/5'-nucleotidase [Streptomyces sp. NPDC005962]|uniref:bifunctional metallophosphatase/5'-nucleotidase n=1 Tax=Streptomyces sp. NPDC005962 TaxID=3154466 RepID=UPI0033EE9A13